MARAPRNMTKKLAKEAALNVQNYWVRQGYLIKVWVIRVDNDDENNRDYAIRSNMRNGVPYGYSGEDRCLS